jgi:hypothetical protein
MIIVVTSPYFCASYDTKLARRPIAPIIRYMRGWSLERIVDYCVRKGWKVEVLGE